MTETRETEALTEEVLSCLPRRVISTNGPDGNIELGDEDKNDEDDDKGHEDNKERVVPAGDEVDPWVPYVLMYSSVAVILTFNSPEELSGLSGF